MPGITNYNAAGFAALQWSRRASGGWITGALNLAVADEGDSSGMARYKGANTADFALTEPTTVNIPGDDGTRAIFQFDGDGLPQFILEMSDFDQSFYAAARGLASVADGDVQATPLPFVGSIGNPLTLMLTRRLKSAKLGQVGAAGYEHLPLLNCEVGFLGSGYNTKGAAVWRWQVTCNNADVLPDGRSVSSVFADAPNGEIGAMLLTSDYLYTYNAFVGDGIVTSPVLVQKPISVAKTKSTVETTGFAAGTVSAIDTSSPFGYTLSAAPGAGKYAIARYEFANWAAA